VGKLRFDACLASSAASGGITLNAPSIIDFDSNRRNHRRTKHQKRQVPHLDRGKA